MKKKVLLTSLACLSLLFSGLVACNNSNSSKQESKSESQQSSVAPASSSAPASTPDTSAPEQGSSSSSSAVAHVHFWNLPNSADYEAEWTEVTPATCKAAGSKTWYCECGETKVETIKKLDHTWGDWAPKAGEEATCTADGKEVRTCSACGETEEQVVKAGHSYETIVTKKNASEKDFYIKECSRHDSKYIGIAFDDYSAKDADFDAEANAGKYSEVAESIWADARMLAKTKGTSISWKVHVKKAIKGAQLSIGMTSTYDSHKSTNMANQFKVKVNDGAAAAWSVTGTYEANGLAPTKRTYLNIATIDLVAGENTITLSLESTSNRLLLGGEVRIFYSTNATIVDGSYVPFAGYTVTFTTEHCKVLVYEGKDYAGTPVETNTTLAMDEDGNIVAYDVEDEQPQPQVNFKVVCDDDYSINASNITVTGKYKNLKQNPAKTETPAVDDDSLFRITKVQENLEVSIVAVNGEQAIGRKVSFITNHCSVKVYIGPKNSEGTNLDEIQDGVYYARDKDSPYGISFSSNVQVNFEVVPEAGYKFESGLEVGKGIKVEDGGAPFISGNYNKLSREAENVYQITKVAGDIFVNLKCIPEGGEAGLGYEISFVAEHCSILVYEDGQDYRFTPTAPVGGKTLSRTDNGDAAKYAAKINGVDANGDGDFDDPGDTPEVAEVKPQVNFKVVPEEGYEFVSGIAVGAEASGVTFVSGDYNKVKNMDNGIFRVTKIKGDLIITIAATAIAA